MEILITFLVQASATFLGNLLLLTLIGTHAKRAERRQVRALQEYQELLRKESRKQSERLRKYAEMES
jgi:hypothetical protein